MQVVSPTQFLKQARKPVVVPVPYFEQETEFTCGPAVLKMIMHYFGENIAERRLRKHTKSSPLGGTNHEKLISTVQTLGYHCFVKQNAQPRHLKSFINRGYPIIINWQEPDTKDGHYSVIFGYLSEYFFMHDPYKPTRKVLPTQTLLPLWHDGGQQHWFMVTSKDKIRTSLKGKCYLPR